MKATLTEWLEMLERGETPEQYKKRISRVRRLANERDDLEDAISVLSDPTLGTPTDKDRERLSRKERRLAKVVAEIEALQ